MGYLIIDSRASHEGVKEYDTFHCAHCQCVIDRAGSVVPFEFCGRCAAGVCTRCFAEMQTKGCVPFKRRVDEALERRARRQAWGLSA